MAVPYRASRGEAATVASICCCGVGDIEPCGARRRVQATGLGAPFSFITATIASPVPSMVSTSSRSYPEFGKVETVARSALASSGVNARNWCCTREPSFASTSLGTSLGVWVTKKMPTPFERMSRTVWVIEARKSFDASRNNRWASSKKKTSLGLSRSPTSGRSLNRSASSHIRNVEKRAGRSCTPGTSSRLTTPRPSAVVFRNSNVSISGSPKNTSAPWSANVISSRRITPTVALDSPPSPVSSPLPSSLIRQESTARRSVRSSSGSPAWSA